MAEKFYYQQAPIILGVAGIVITIIGGTIDQYLYHMDNNSWRIWLAMMLVFAFIGFKLGKLVKKLEIYACEDYLTGLYNRRQYNKLLENEVQRQSRTHLPFSIAMIDVDNFKLVNDSYGHKTGDNVLIKLAQIFRDNIRAIDTVSRWGGDEFAIIFPETDAEAAFQAAERMRFAVEKADVAICHATISIGIVCCSTEMRLEDLLTLADEAMYEAKRGKNTAFILKPSLAP